MSDQTTDHATASDAEATAHINTLAVMVETLPLFEVGALASALGIGEAVAADPRAVCLALSDPNVAVRLAGCYGAVAERFRAVQQELIALANRQATALELADTLREHEAAQDAIDRGCIRPPADLDSLALN